MYYKLKCNTIKEYNNTSIKINFLKQILHYVAYTYPFSTFGYLKNYNSKKCLLKTNSGNCISLSLITKDILKEFNIKSFLIPATVPYIYKFDGSLDIAHVALCVPCKNHVYILDPAFYFKEPMVITMNNYNYNSIKSHNVYSNIENTIHYKLEENPNLYFNFYQHLPSGTASIISNYSDNSNDTWNYYITEILNPDEAITNFFMHLKRYPFIAVLNSDYSLKLLVKFLDKNTVMINSNGYIYQGSPKEIPLNIVKLIKNNNINLKLPKNIEKKIYKFK